MKKILFSLAALVCSMSMNAQVMKVMKNGVEVAKYKGAEYSVVFEEEVFEEEQEGGVTLTIAYPAQNTVDANYQLTGWEAGDVVTLYKATPGEKASPQNDFEGKAARVSGAGVAFTCINASTGTFSATLPDGENIDDYNLALFGATAENIGEDYDGKLLIKPTTWSSTDLKDVVMMGAVKEGASFTMKVINNVMKIENQSGADVTVAWYGFDYYPEVNHYFELASVLGPSDSETWKWYGNRINSWGGENPTWADVPHFTLVNSAVNYVNFPMVDGYTKDMIGLYTEGGTAVVPMKSISGRTSSEWSTAYCGHLEDEGTYNGNPL